ncbi:MAG: M23 family metallopeptidase [Sphingomonas sp.]
MSRVGWVFLTLFVLVIGGFLTMLRFGGAAPAPATTAAEAEAPPAATPAPDTAGVPSPPLTVPVAGVTRSQLTDSWGDPRGGGARQHEGTDIMAAAGTPVVAAGPGTIEKLFQSHLGGTTLYERSADGQWQYYYAHLSGYAPGVHEGQRVTAGTLLGYVGDTGDAAPGAYQLHFGVSRMQPGEGWWQGTPVDPYPLLAGTAADR